VAESPHTDGIEVVRGSLAGDRAEAVVRFLGEHAGIPDAEARDELDRVLCVLPATGEELAAVSLTAPAVVPLVKGARLWLHRTVTAPGAEGAEDDLIASGFAALEAGFDPDGREPIGLLDVIPSAERMREEAVCPRTGLLHAGFLERGPQVRIRFFAEASIGPRLVPLPPASERGRPPQLDERHRIEPLAESGVGSDDVLALWERERALPAAVAERRVHEVDLVAIDERDGLVAVSSSYLQRNRRLRMDLHHFRAYVAEEHRRSSLAFLLALRGRDHLEARYETGEDTRAAGILYEVENELLKRYRNEAHWAATDFTYIGENENGAHLRIHYFPGARVPVSA
jgi:hypothetical protein